ncbi:long-chain fatty acid--CoA ligase [Micromonospora sp. NPDC049274]|uniref:class I adenylate-forming enzyme family protein n=1 Tax=Micromonospora sp. NPDC049274 TaxID=3154829 RepID=UPI00341ADECB
MSSKTWWDPIGGYAADILSALAEDPERVVLYWRDQEVSGARFIGVVAAAYRAMGELDAGPGSVVGILVEPNSPDMLATRYAAHLRGAAVCYLRTSNPGSNAAILSADDQLRVLRETGAAVVYTDKENLGLASGLAKEAGIAVLGPITGRDDLVVPVGAEPWDPRRLAVIGYTSGSTGRPKGIRLSGRAWESTVRTAQPPGQGRTVMLVNTPLSHTVGPMVDGLLLTGATVVLREEFQAGQFLRDVAERQVTRSFIATAHLYQLIDHLEELGNPDFMAAQLSSLRLLIYSGTAAAPSRVARAARLIGPRLAQVYGTSEGGRVTFLDPGGHFDPWLSTTVGRPFPGVEISVRDAESAAEVPDGDTGQVWMCSPAMMDGYWNDPELSARVLRDGWYATGDTGYRDEKGYLHLLGRLADVVKVDAVKVHPAVVEAEILTLDGIRQAAVFGRRDEDSVESLQCAIAFQPGATLTVDDVRAHLREALSPAHVPQVVDVLDELPLTNAGKPDKVLLRSRAGTRT